MNIEHDNNEDTSAKKLDTSKNTHSDTNVEHDNNVGCDNSTDISAKNGIPVEIYILWISRNRLHQRKHKT